MSGLSVTPVRSARDRGEFMQLAWRLYKDDPNWVPPLRGNFKQLVGWKRHPFQEIAEQETFLARRGGQVVGRICAILNHEHNRVHQERRGFFGFFESIDDPEVAAALLESARHWLAERDVRAIRGPVNPSMNYECGLLIEGFDSPPTFMMTYNPPYYARLIEGCGFAKAHDLLAYFGHIEQLPKVAERLKHLVEGATERAGAVVRPMNKKRFRQEVELFLEMYNRACGTMWGFVPLTRGEVRELAASLKHLLVPELAVAVEAEGKTAGVVLCLPDFNPAIKEIDGRLFPFGFWKLLRAKDHIRRVRVVSINVVPEFQRWGLGIVLLGGLVPRLLSQGIQEVEFSWVSETNDLARMGLEKGGARITKRYRLYDRE
jgi:hypothetical protein